MKESLILGIDIGGTNLRLGLVDRNYSLSHFVIESSQNVLSGSQPVLAIISIVKAYCDQYMGGSLPSAISIGFPSTIDRERKHVTSSPNVRSLQNLAVVDEMEAAFEIPVFLERDVNFLLAYDIASHQLDKNATIVGFYIGTGLGNAILIGGELLLGKNGVAAELGHIPMYNGDIVCGCGNIGCAETVASGTALERIRDIHFPDTKISQMFSLHKDTQVVQNYLNTLSLPIATEVNIFDPDYIIIGGGVPHMDDFPREDLHNYIYKHARKPYPAENLEIYYSSPNQENGVIGAAIHAFKKLI